MQTREEIEKRVTDMIVDITDMPAEEILPDSVLMEDIDISSIEIMTMIADIEAEYGIRLSTDEMHDIICIRDMVDIVEQKLKEKN